MAITYTKSVPVSTISTFRIGGVANEMATVENESDIQELFQNLPKSKKWFVVGGGSNIVFPDGDFDSLLIHFASAPVRFEKIDDVYTHVIAPAGAIWDDVVRESVERGLSGIEALSAIPGTAGATPIQNVGAYGVETSDVFYSLRAFDVETSDFVVFSRDDCKFGYRNSIFKNEGKGRYIISEVTYRLSNDEPNVPQYPGVADYFAEKGITRANLQEIRDAIIHIRSNKLPDPRIIASVGSFFQNAIVSKEKGEQLKRDFPTLAVFPIDETRTKIGTGSMIDGMGWKGKHFGTISTYKGNALVLVNEGGATREELGRVISQITQEVFRVYGVEIYPEPELL